MSVLVLVLGACSKSPTAPTTPTAHLSPIFNNLAMESCSRDSPTSLICDYHGDARNTGPGCATNVRGVTRSYFPAPNSSTVFDTNAWTYGEMVHANEQFVYRGTRLRIPDVEWHYETTITWDNVSCP